MQVSLFRREAAEHQRTKIFGEAMLALPVSYAATTGFLSLFVAALICFISVGTYARREHVSGFLVSTLGIAKIMPPRPGIIVAVHVTEGQMVQQGAPLLTVSAEQTTDLGEGADRSKLQALRDQGARLREQIALQRDKAEMVDARLRDVIDGLSTEVAALQAARQTQLKRVELARQEIAAILETVAKGYISQLELKRRQDNYLAQRQSEESLGREIAAKAGELGQRKRELQQLPVDTADQVSRLEADVSAVEMRLLETDEHRAYLLKAPLSGRVSALQAWVGKTAEPAIPQLSIVPEGTALLGELLVPARAIGFVTPGQAVRLSYDTFPYQQFGLADGLVETVSHTLLKPDELIGPALVKEPSYRISVALQRQSITAYGREIPLQPDMQLKADILFERRTLIAWLLDPLFAAMRVAR
jgi:membrane fusion protein